MYTKISEDLFLVKHEVRLETRGKSTVNHIWIFDRSGSMYMLLPHLVEDLIKHTDSLKIGDTLSVGWFSGEGQYRFVLKGFEISDRKSKERINAILRQYKRTVGRTCFSEILEDASAVADELSIFPGPFALLFLTDGYPVVSDYDYELKRIFEVLESLKGRVASSLFVGYGDYYNRDLLSGMSALVDGTLIHSSRLSEFSTPMDEFVQSVSGSGLVPVDISGPIYRAAAIGTRFVGTAKVSGHPWTDRNGVVISADTRSVAVLVRTRPSGQEVPRDELLPEIYAMAYTCLMSDPDISIQLMQSIGDVRFIDLINNAWTNDEYGRIAAGLKEAVHTPDARFVNGQDLAYSVRGDAFCVLDLMKLLAQDTEARFYPIHSSFVYKRIGARTITADGYPKFFPGSSGCKTTDLVWNDERLNLSIRAKISGHIELEDNDFGFGSTFPTHVWRNYTLIRDGNLNVTKLPVSTSEATHKILWGEGLVGEPWIAGKPYTINLKSIPVINRDISYRDVEASWYCDRVWEKLEIDGILKALKSLRKEFEPEKRLESDLLTDEQISYLESCGITRNGFSPPVESTEVDDVYYANTLTVYPKGFSSLPSLNAVRKKHDANKRQTPSGELVLAGLHHFFDNCPYDKKEEIVAWLDKEIEQYRSDSIAIAYELQEAKFAVLAGKRWFVGLPIGDEVTYTADDGLLFIFKKDKKEIKY